MDENRLKQWIDDSAQETRRHFDVIAEGLKHEIRLIAEGHQSLTDKVDVLASGQDALHAELGQLRAEMRVEFKEVRSWAPSPVSC